jgi:hypothetical protein
MLEPKQGGHKMAGIKDLNSQYITHEAGERISVVLPISKFEELLENWSRLQSGKIPFKIAPLR